MILLLKVYDFPIFYFPKIFSSRSNGKKTIRFFNAAILLIILTVGFSTSIPYFWAISEDKDMTLTPKIYARENVLIKNEYRQAFKNSFLLLILAILKDIKKIQIKKHQVQEIIFLQTLDTVFQKMTKIIIVILEINLEHVSNDTYLEVHDINTKLQTATKIF